MQSQPVDIDPEQVVRWIRAELAAAPTAFRVIASRSADVREIRAGSIPPLGEEETKDLSERVVLAALTIEPTHTEGWRLNIVVEDDVGPQLDSDAETVETEDEIDLDTFYEEFIRPGRGIAYVTAEVESPQDRSRLTRLLSRIERDVHRANVEGRR